MGRKHLQLREFRLAQDEYWDGAYMARLMEARRWGAGMPASHYVKARIAHIDHAEIGEGGGLQKWGQFIDAVY